MIALFKGNLGAHAAFVAVIVMLTVTAHSHISLEQIVFNGILAAIAFPFLSRFFKGRGTGYLKPLLACFGLAVFLRVAGAILGAQTVQSLVSWILGLGVFVGLPALAFSGRGREAMQIALVNQLLLPTPLIGAAKAFGWFGLGWLTLFAFRGMFPQVGEHIGGAMGVIIFAACLFACYVTPIRGLIGAWGSAGRMTAARKVFDEAAQGFPAEYRYHDNNWSGFAVDPASKTVVIAARRVVDGDASGQSPEVLSLKFDDITDCGCCAPGYAWQGVLVGAGAFAAGASFVASLNDLTWQRTKSAFHTGLWFALRSGDLYIVQAPEKHLENLASVLKGTLT